MSEILDAQYKNRKSELQVKMLEVKDPALLSRAFAPQIRVAANGIGCVR